jgi:hypothetical protein
MALKKQKLVDGLKDAFTKAKEVEEKTKKDSEGNDIKVSEAINSQSDIAGFITDAIVSYASDAEITISAPFTIPATPPSPDPSVVGKKLKVQTAQVGKAALKSAVVASMNSQDPAASAISSAIVVYAAASFTAFAAGAVTAAGVSVMAVPPLLVAPLAVGIAGGEEDDVINGMATVIHTSFLGTAFTGLGANAGIPVPSATVPPPVGAGPVVSTLS